MRPVLVITLLFVLLSTAALAANPVVEQARNTFEPIPFGMPELPNNPATTDKIELGKTLFFDPRLSRSGLISCNTCHNVGWEVMISRRPRPVTAGRKAHATRRQY